MNPNPANVLSLLGNLSRNHWANGDNQAQLTHELFNTGSFPGPATAERILALSLIRLRAGLPPVNDEVRGAIDDIVTIIMRPLGAIHDRIKARHALVFELLGLQGAVKAAQDEAATIKGKAAAAAQEFELAQNRWDAEKVLPGGHIVVGGQLDRFTEIGKLRVFADHFLNELVPASAAKLTAAADKLAAFKAAHPDIFADASAPAAQ